jgi:hypothetical protein
MKKIPLILTSVLASVLVLTSCSSGTDGKPPPDLTFQNVIPVNLPVSDINVERASGYNAATNATSFVVPFSDKIESYVRRKMQAMGGDKRLRVIIEDASVKEHFQPSDNKVAGFLDVAGFTVYDLSLVMNVRAEDSYGGNKGVRLKLGRTIKVSEHASVAERELRQTEGVEALFRELDTNMTRITLQELDLIPYQSGGSVYVPPADTSAPYDAAPAYEPMAPSSGTPRVIMGGPSTGGGPTGASTEAIERQEL